MKKLRPGRGGVFLRIRRTDRNDIQSRFQKNKKIVRYDKDFQYHNY